MEASRIANVSAALLVGFAATPIDAPGSGRAHSLAELMARLFEDTLQVGGPRPAAPSGRHVPWREDRRDAVVGIAAAIEAARGERVIVVGEGDPRISAELLLALVAWPEAAVVMPVDAAGSNPLRAIYRRDDLLARARAVLEGAGPPPSFDAFFAGVEIVRVPIARLGLAGPPALLLADPFADPVDPRVGSRAVG